MKSAKVAELRTSFKRECTQIPRGLLVMCAIPLLRVVSRVWTRMDVNLRTDGDRTIKFENSHTFRKLNLLKKHLFEMYIHLFGTPCIYRPQINHIYIYINSTNTTKHIFCARRISAQGCYKNEVNLASFSLEHIARYKTVLAVCVYIYIACTQLLQNMTFNGAKALCKYLPVINIQLLLFVETSSI